MSEFADARADVERTAETLTTFVIFCEDEISEPLYFKYFETERIKVNTVPKQKSKLANVVKAISYGVRERLIIYVEGRPKLEEDNTIIWCVFDLDQDKEANPEKQSEQSVEFDVAIEIAQQSGIKVAFSNDAFELWVLLHFEEVNPENADYKNREIYYQQLTKHFKSINEPGADLAKALVHTSFGYKRDLKQANNFRSIVRSEMISKTHIAIERAKTLEAYHQTKPAKPNHQKAPCTLVHHLVTELMKYGGKEIN